jgi:23S rRNA pseudouridine1911/1915/1917 synthase
VPDDPTAEPLEVLYDDPHVLAVAKPAGLLTQGVAAGEPTLEQAVRRLLSPGAPVAVYLGTVHRLDRPVSGVVLWARTPKSARRLAAQFAGRTVIKEYWALVECRDDPPAPGEEGEWDDWLAGSADASGVVRASAEGRPGARRALTRFRREPEGSARLPDGLAWLRLWPRTGRTHQLRAQAAARGLPIWGDAAYGAARPFAPGAVALHARSLTFRHPTSGRDMTLRAPLPGAWAAQGVTRPGPA